MDTSRERCQHWGALAAETSNIEIETTFEHARGGMDIKCECDLAVVGVVLEQVPVGVEGGISPRRATAAGPTYG
jgi:hypothetical protein